MTSLLGKRFGAAGMLSSQPILFSNRRFASTNTTTTSTSSTPVSEFSADNVGYTSASNGRSIGSDGAFDVNGIVDPVDLGPLADIPQQVGYLSELGIDFGRGPSAICSWLIEHSHFDLGLPWWGAVVAAAVILRVVLFYPSLIGNESSRKFKELQEDPVYKERMTMYRALALTGNSQPMELMKLRNQMSLMRNQRKIKMWQMGLPILQFPLAFGMFRVSRAMASLPLPGLDVEKFLWMTDMTVHDPLYLLPCISVALMYWTMRSTGTLDPSQAAMAKIAPWILGPVTIAFTMFMPAVTQLYFVAGSVLSYLQVVLNNAAPVRKLFGLSPSPPKPQPGHGGGPKYEAPRTIGTTATEHVVPAKKPTSIRETFHAAKSELMEKARSMRGEQNSGAPTEGHPVLNEAERKAQDLRDFEARRQEFELRRAKKAAARKQK